MCICQEILKVKLLGPKNYILEIGILEEEIA